MMLMLSAGAQPLRLAEIRYEALLVRTPIIRVVLTQGLVDKPFQ